MTDPKVKFTQAGKVAIFANHNDALVLEIDSLTIVGRTANGRGVAQRIEIEAPLYLDPVDNKLKITLPAPQLIPIASQEEAEAGTDNQKFMTPLRVTEETTARLASEAEAVAGTDPDKLMTPLRVAQAWGSLLAVSYVTGIGNTTVTIPPKAHRAFVQVQGVGGGYPGSESAAGSPGGYLEKFLTGLVPGRTLIATIPTRPGINTDGGDTKLASGTQTIDTLTAGGGKYNNSAGGTASGGDLNIPGARSHWEVDASGLYGLSVNGWLSRSNGEVDAAGQPGYGWGGYTDRGKYPTVSVAGGPAIIIIHWYG